MLRQEHGAPTGLFGAKTLHDKHKGPNRPPLVQKTLRDKHGAPTDLLWGKKRYVTITGPQPTN